MQYWLMKSEPDTYSIDDLQSYINELMCRADSDHYNANKDLVDSVLVNFFEPISRKGVRKLIS